MKYELTVTASLKPFSFSILFGFALELKIISFALANLASSIRYRFGQMSLRRSEIASEEALSPWYLLEDNYKNKLQFQKLYDEKK